MHAVRPVECRRQLWSSRPSMLVRSPATARREALELATASLRLWGNNTPHICRARQQGSVGTARSATKNRAIAAGRPKHTSVYCSRHTAVILVPNGNSHGHGGPKAVKRPPISSACVLLSEACESRADVHVHVSNHWRVQLLQRSSMNRSANVMDRYLAQENV
jgi:hypothetical protein